MIQTIEKLPLVLHSVLLSMVWLPVNTARALPPSNIDDAHKHAWAENIGWTNSRDADNIDAGVVVDDTFLSGFSWSENAGWINFGDGSPANGVRYLNNDASDFGVNINPTTGDLFGLAWGENIGWVNFDTSVLGSERARYDDCEDRFFGFAWAENVGWLNLDDTVHYVGTSPDICETCPGDTNGDNIVDTVDLLQMLGDWGPCAGCASDFDDSGTVDVVDLLIMLGAWGVC